LRGKVFFFRCGFLVPINSSESISGSYAGERRRSCREKMEQALRDKVQAEDVYAALAEGLAKTAFARVAAKWFPISGVNRANKPNARVVAP